MKYVILIHGNPASREMFQRLPDEQRAAGFAAYAALREDLTASGEYIVSEALADPSAGRRLPAQGGATPPSDGPFAEVKEHLAGFFLIDCESMDRALEYAARVPEAAIGLVEVRPVMTYRELDV